MFPLEGLWENGAPANKTHILQMVKIYCRLNRHTIRSRIHLFLTFSSLHRRQLSLSHARVSRFLVNVNQFWLVMWARSADLRELRMFHVEQFPSLRVVVAAQYSRQCSTWNIPQARATHLCLQLKLSHTTCHFHESAVRRV